MTLEQAVDHLIATNPTFAVKTARIRGIDHDVFANAPENLRGLMVASRKAQGDGAADYLVYGVERWTYDSFCHEVNLLSDALKVKLNIRPGDRVAIAMRNCPELPILILAISNIGAVVVFLNAWWTTKELDYALQDTGTQLIFADGVRMNRLLSGENSKQLQLVGTRDGEGLTGLDYSTLRDISPNAATPKVEIDADQDFAIMYSSGTTSDPKGVVLTHRGAINAVFTWAMQAALAPLLDPPPPDAPPALRPSALVMTPLFHVTATHPGFLLSMPAGVKLCLLDKWDPDVAVQMIEAEQITRVTGVPTQCADLIAASERLGTSLETLDLISSGGAKRPPIQVSELARRFPHANINTGWGMTETNAIGIGFNGQEYQDNPNAAGRLFPPLQQVRFLDDQGRQVAVGEVGEITVKSPCNMRCYLNKPEATDEVLQDGWLRTGDLGRIDAGGLITIVDRKKNIIIRGGENIACLDVEAAIHRHPDVAEACVFSLPHQRLGEVVGAAVQTRPDATLTQEALIAFLAEHLARFKHPEQVWFQATSLPRAATDKIDRRKIRAACLASIT
ncbi:MAG: acyl--CoA ligase [Rhodobacteraceae bacterium]|nr:acyl--CoA ligase [Paracoccaceae bacterium]